jgi:hypothetical protein
VNDLILYTTDDGKSHIQLRADLGTVWLTQLEMAELFNATKQNISLHLKNIFEDGELDANSVVKESLTTAARAPQKSTVKKSLTVQIKLNQTATTEECSVVETRDQKQSQWRPHHG